MMLSSGLSNRQALPLSLAHVSLLFAGLMWVFPFLNYYHAYPLTTFYQEWGAAVLGLVAAAFVLVGARYWQQAEVPGIILLPIALLLLVVVQFALGKIPYLGQALLFSLYLMWAALVMMLGQRLRDELGLPALATALAVFLVAGAELSALAGMVQQYGWHSILDRVVTAKVSTAVYGNIAQPNHFADYLVLGLASLGLLYARGSLRAWQAALLALPMLFVLPLSGSRSAWLYLAALVALAYLWARRDQAGRALFRYSALVLLGFALMHGVLELPFISAGSARSVTTVQRLAGDVHSGGIRLYLWHESWLMFLHYPLLGAGFGQFAWQHFQLAPTLQDPHLSGLYNNAHNLVMQLAAETGVAGLAVLFGTLALWLGGARRAERSIYHWWGYAVLATLAIHSLLEYPLWYAHFIGIAALVLGMLDTRGHRLELRNAGRAFTALTLVLGLLSLQQLASGIRSLETIMAPRPQAVSSETWGEQVHKELASLQGMALLRPYADLYASPMLDASPEGLAGKLEYNGNVMRFIPISPAVYRQALLLVQAGDLDAARLQEERAIWAYPGDYPQHNAELRALAGKDPARYAALLEFSLRKFEEYQGAVHTK